MIKAVIFDLGRVLVGGEWRVIYKKISKEVKMPAEKVREIRRSLLTKWETGKFAEEKFWKMFEKRIGKKINRKFRKDLWFRTYRNHTRDIKGTWKILSKLKAQKIRLALITNTIPPHVKTHIKTGRVKRLKDLGFKIIIRSCEVNMRKPDARIYKLALKKLKLPAKVCVFVDDNLAFVKAARKLGIQGIQFHTPKQLRKDLKKLGALE